MPRTLLLAGLLLTASPLDAQETEPLRTLRLKPDESRAFAEKLAKRISVDFDETPLNEAIEHIATATELPLYIDEIGLEEEVVEIDEPVSLLRRESRADDVLTSLLEPLGLEYQIKHRGVEITSFAFSLGDVHNLLYDVRPLQASSTSMDRYGYVLHAKRSYALRPPRVGEEVTPSPTWPGLQGRERWLADAIVVAVDPFLTEDVLRTDDVRSVGGLFSIELTQRAHRKLDRFLVELSRLAASEPGQPTVRPLMPAETMKILRLLREKRVSFDLADRPLNEVVVLLRDELEINVDLDFVALEDEVVEPDIPLTVKVKDVPARVFLKRLLEPLGLTWEVRHSALVITSQVISEELSSPGQLAVIDSRDVAARLGGTERLAASLKPTGGPKFFGEPRRMHVVLGGLVVTRGTEADLERIENTLTALRAALPPRAIVAPPAADAMRVLDYSVPEHDAGQVVELVRAFVTPRHWDADDGGTIRAVGHRLFVRTTLENHASIHELLSELETEWSAEAEQEPAAGAE